MASALIIILPVTRITLYERLEGVDLANQTLAPSADRRNITELWRVRIDREYQEMASPKPGKDRSPA